MTPDYTKAAVKAAETLIKFGVKVTPVSPMVILENMENVILKPFAEITDSLGVDPCDMRLLAEKSCGAISSVHTNNGKSWYVVAYNNLLPHTMVQNALARELGHIVLRHEEGTPETDAEAVCFAQHLLCPRPLIHSVQATGMRLTKDVLANLTGVFHQCLIHLRKTPGTAVPAGLNRFVRSQLMPFILNFFDYYASLHPEDSSAMVDFGTYMDGYEE